MVLSPTGSTTETSPIDPQAQADGNVIDAQLISTVASTQFPPVYTSSTPMATYAQQHREASCQDTQLAGILPPDLVCLQNT